LEHTKRNSSFSKTNKTIGLKQYRKGKFCHHQFAFENTLKCASYFLMIEEQLCGDYLNQIK
jgi:hypothetical protein